MLAGLGEKIEPSSSSLYAVYQQAQEPVHQQPRMYRKQDGSSGHIVISLGVEMKGLPDRHKP